MGEMGFWEQTLIYFMLGVFPWIFVAVGAWLLWSAHQFMGRAQRTIGRVLHVTRQVSTSSDNGTSVSYKPTFEYVDEAGNTRQGETFLASSSYNFDVGTEREILLDPKTGQIRMPGWLIYGFGAIFAGIGLLFGIVGIFAIIAMT